MKQALTRRQLSRMITDIDMSVFAIRSRLASFTAALLYDMADRAGTIDLSIVCGNSDGARVVRCGGVYLDPEHGLIMVSAAGGAGDLPWDELTLASQHQIAQDLSVRYLSGETFGALA
jgi:hypothetical protein